MKPTNKNLEKEREKGRKHCRKGMIVIRLSIALLFTVTLLISSAYDLHCPAHGSANVSHPAHFWCGLTATVDVQSACTTKVMECVTVPWTTRQFVRVVPHQQNQKIVSVETFLLQSPLAVLIPPNDTMLTLSVSLESVTVSLEGGANTAITVTTNPSIQPATLIVRYVVIPGVIAFSSCGKGTPILPAMPSPSASSTTDAQHGIMLTRWALGGTSVSRLNLLAISFRTTVASDRGLVDVFSHSGQLSVITNSSNSETVVVIHGNTSHIIPADIVLYARLWRISTRLSCASARDCRSERNLLNEGKPRRAWKGIVVVVVTVILVLIAVFLGVWFWFRRVKQGDNDDDHDDATQPASQLPSSLHHFAYDTGDEISSRTWREWTDFINRKPVTPVVSNHPTDHAEH